MFGRSPSPQPEEHKSEEILFISLGKLLPDLNHGRSGMAFATYAAQHLETRKPGAPALTQEVLESLMPTILALSKKYNEGRCTTEEFRAEMLDTLGFAAGKVSEQAFDDMWCAMLGTTEQLVALPNCIESVKQAGDFKMVIPFSNTNPIHANRQRDYLPEEITCYFSYEYRDKIQPNSKWDKIFCHRIITESGVPSKQVNLVVQPESQSAYATVKDHDEGRQQERAEMAHQQDWHVIEHNKNQDLLVIISEKMAAKRLAQQKEKTHIAEFTS
jgi:hypothetical protein